MPLFPHSLQVTSNLRMYPASVSKKQCKTHVINFHIVCIKSHQPTFSPSFKVTAGHIELCIYLGQGGGAFYYLTISFSFCSKQDLVLPLNSPKWKSPTHVLVQGFYSINHFKMCKTMLSSSLAI